MKVQTPTSSVTLTDVLHEAHVMRDEELARLIRNAWHRLSFAFGRLAHARTRQTSPVRLAK